MVQFFGKIDKQDNTGKIRSQYPAWYFDNSVSELKENIDRKRRELKQGIIPLDVLPNFESDLEKEEKRYQDIVDSQPKMSDKDKDDVSKSFTSMGKKIQDSMFTHTEMDMGLASANEEARRMVDPVIDVTDKEIEVLKSVGIEHRNGKVSRNQLIRCWQIMGKSLGEDVNAERLRKPGTTNRRYIVR